MGSERIVEVLLPVDTSHDELLVRATERAYELGLDLEGDATGGTFDGVAEGTFEVQGDKVLVRVTSKPTFLPWRLLEGQIAQIFAP